MRASVTSFVSISRNPAVGYRGLLSVFLHDGAEVLRDTGGIERGVGRRSGPITRDQHRGVAFLSSTLRAPFCDLRE